MTERVRVFVSSTMDDLANERQAVVDQIADVGMEPVNAEGLLPNGKTSWDLLEDEIRTCHLCVLLGGDRYGWIPDTGHGADQQRSVTRLEVQFARSLAIPILPFLKRLNYNPKARTFDETRRDAFREELGDWAHGHFRAEFDLAKDLGEKVRKALLDIMLDHLAKSLIRERVARTASATPPAAPAWTLATHMDSFLYAGAGLSIAAGYPSAAILAEALGRRLGLNATGHDLLSRHPFADLAAFAELRLGRDGVMALVRELLDTPLPVEPSRAHMAAVQSFPLIVTTNYDMLFEQACDRSGLRYRVQTATGSSGSTQPKVTILKLDGSISDPDTMVLTEADARRAAAGNADLWRDVADILQRFKPVVIGHALRDATSRRLLAARNPSLDGVYVSPHLDELDAIMLHRFGLTGVRSTAEAYLTDAGRR
jgi:hypothetical protein